MKEQEMISGGGPKSLKIPKFEIDLEEDPYTRWSEPTIYFKEQIIKLHETIISFVPWSIRSIFWMVTKYMEVFSPKTTGLGELNHQLFREFEGVSDITGIPLADVLTANFDMSCLLIEPSIVAIDKTDSIVHARNLDYPIYESMRNDTFDIDFVKNGELVFKGVGTGGSTNSYTIMKPGAFAVSINARYHNDLPGLANSLSRWFMESYNPGSLLIYVGEHANTFEEAKDMLMNMPITSICYFTLSGVEIDEGVVITRDRTGAKDLWPINPNSQSDWAIYQTNYDHWENAPERDNKRAATVKEGLVEIGRDKMTVSKILKRILQKPPVLQYDTIFAVTMSAKKNLFKIHAYI
eukprot:CAMPEP_0197014912 /NCGR_PEP_ID=MMETSP1380-20130617/72121_1 /TAXON_ID=5936 /ORGANISM="Euplotes crassus, Strain CT5" /LENGTH=350 /DNA_ID=CAMNT_0042440401 /DNA_START=95 /DNA_END=1147 /DNA_ORIENTATION=-